MGIAEEIREAVEHLRHDAEEAAEAASQVIARFTEQATGPAFAVLRRVNPIVSVGKVTVVALNVDVREVLGDPTRFTIGLYEPKMTAVTGPFILGLDEVPLYDHDHKAMRAAVRAEDMPALGDATLAHARALVAAAGGQIDVVSGLADPVLDQSIADYFGTPGPDTPTQLRWARDIFEELFINVKNKPEVTERALADAAGMRPHLDAQVAARKAALAAGEDVPDDVLTRLLRAQGEEPSLHDVAIRHNILGNIVGWIPTISKSLALAVEELLDRPEELAGAQRAARAGDRALVGAYLFEALRFRPQNFALLRACPDGATIAAGTDRETEVEPGSVVVAATQSAMHDEDVIPEPEEFRLDRPWGDYMHFGYALHTCFGEAIARAQMPALATALFEGADVSRADGDAGELEWEGPFPSGLSVQIG